MASNLIPQELAPPPRLGWRTVVLVLLFYTASVLAATYPVVLTFTTRVPGSRTDPLQALWVMRWYRQCLCEGKSPYHCADIQAPVGAALGNFSPLHFQALLYLPLSCVLANDVLCYNLIWLFNLVFTGLGTFLLIWQVLRDRRCACFGGLTAMLSGPMLIHAFGHLELITLGWFPLFLAGWMRWLDEPSRRRLFLAVGLYVLVCMSAAYFGVFALVPAVLYAAGQMLANGRSGILPWLRVRLGAFAAFAGLTVPLLLLLFSSQLWSRAHGYSLSRPRGEFDFYGAPAWSSAVPSSYHTLGRVLPSDWYARTPCPLVECCSYLGIVTLLLIGYAAVRRVAFRRARYWWTLLVLLGVLSLGASWQIGSVRVGLPAGWLRTCCGAFRLIRAPARFNLCTAVCAALVASAGLGHLLDRLPRRGRSRRGSLAVCAVLSLLAIADLAIVPFPTMEFPAMPGCYAALRQRNPHATVLEVPQFGSGWCVDLNAACAYWQSHHRGRTTAGYSGFDNLPYDNLVWQSSPFANFCLADPEYLKQPEAMDIDLVKSVRFTDYAWLYLTVHHLDYVVLHEDPGLFLGQQFHFDRLKAALAGAAILRDGRTTVYDRSLLPPPRRPVLLCTTGWRQREAGKDCYVGLLTRTGRLTVFNPSPDGVVTFHLMGNALHRRRTLRLLSEGRELYRWRVGSDGWYLCNSQPFQLPQGLSELVLESDGEEIPTRGEMLGQEDPHPYSLHVAGIRLDAQP
jgi:hypothetical protein